jgi:hypothetical protein
MAASLVLALAPRLRLQGVPNFANVTSSSCE